MGTSLLTKKRIAKVFKKQLAERGFDKVSIVDMMQEAQMRRQTFYNHFLDKYELLDWIFETELQEQVMDNLDYISGWKLLDELLYYIESNQAFYVQVFAVKGQNDFSSFLRNYCQVLIEKIVDEYCQRQGKVLEADYRRFLQVYHARGLVGLIEEELGQKPCCLHQSYGRLVELLTASMG